LPDGIEATIVKDGAELTTNGSNNVERVDVYKTINSISDKEESPQQWTE
jgi:hypothetical protein